jgi:cytochrome c553
MTRVVIFLFFVLGLVVTIGLKKNQKLAVSNSQFNYEATKLAYDNKKKEIETLAAMAHKKMEKVEVKKVEKVLVELTTPQLKSGAALYKKCVMCHGKTGNGKKSQQAPKIGGQYDWYLKLQIETMKAKKRVNPKMDPYIRKLSSQDISDLAVYISKLPW